MASSCEDPTAPLLAEDELILHGRVMPASNATYVADLAGTTVVYKPIAGERPLWDFPDGTLADREVSAYLVSAALGWSVVPPTVLREGPHGWGMVQLWCEPDATTEAVDVVPVDQVPDNYLTVFEGVDAHDRPVVLVHEDSLALRRMALFDALVNNADRKGGHVLAMQSGERLGVDHGLTFHEEPKLRTVLWGWLGEPISESDLADIADLLGSDVLAALGERLRPQEVEAFAARCRRLLDRPVMPGPSGGMPALPWPPL